MIWRDNNLENAIKKIKECSHNLSKLIEQINEEKFHSIFREKDLKYLKVSNRYSIEADVNFRGIYGETRLEYASTINDFNWMSDLYTKTDEWVRFIINNYNNSKEIKTFKSNGIASNLEQISAEWKEIQKLFNK